MENAIPNSSTLTSLGQNGFKKEKIYATINLLKISNHNKPKQTYVLTNFTLIEVQLNGAPLSGTIMMTREEKN